MKKALLFGLALIAVAPAAVEAQQELRELVREGNTYLKRSLVLRRLTPYTGKVIDWYGRSKDQVYLRGTLRRGVWHGSYRKYHKMRASVEMVVEGGEYNMGQRCGRWLEPVYPVNRRPDLPSSSRALGNKEVIHPPC
jgi:hypothetical protein